MRGDAPEFPIVLVTPTDIFFSKSIRKSFISRTPSIQTMSPEIFLFPTILTKRYYFLEIVKNEFDFVKNEGFPKNNLLYDKLENSIYEYTMYNDDFTSKVTVDIIPQEAIDDEIVFWKILEADDLFSAYKNGQLKGKLREVAAKLDEESNPILMLAKYY